MKLSFEDIRQRRHEEIAKGESSFFGIPDRWYEDVHFRCESGHVSRCILLTENRGDRCFACDGPVMMTFPEDVDDCDGECNDKI